MVFEGGNDFFNDGRGFNPDPARPQFFIGEVEQIHENFVRFFEKSLVHSYFPKRIYNPFAKEDN